MCHRSLTTLVFCGFGAISCSKIWMEICLFWTNVGCRQMNSEWAFHACSLLGNWASEGISVGDCWHSGNCDLILGTLLYCGRIMIIWSRLGSLALNVLQSSWSCPNEWVSCIDDLKASGKSNWLVNTVALVAWSSLCTLGWTQTHRNLPASASPVLELKAVPPRSAKACF